MTKGFASAAALAAALGSVLIGAAARAQGAPPAICQSAGPGAIQRLASMPQGQYAAWWPEFFEDSSGGSRRLFAAVMCSTSIHAIQNGGNCVVDLETGRIAPAPGWFDGQWVKDPDDEPIFTIPNKFNVAKGAALPGLTFFRFSDVQKLGRGAPVLYRDPGFGNHYHSFGRVERGVDAEGRRFAINRAMNDKWGVSIRDYRFVFDHSGRVASIQPAGPERNLANGPGDTEIMRAQPAASADPNPHNSYFDLPMISPDGRLFAVNNRRTMTTQIFEIVPEGKRLVADLGIETGKLSFAPRKPGADYLYVAFHVDQLDPAEGDKMSGLHQGMTKDIVSMKLFERRGPDGRFYCEPGQIVRVTAAGRLGDGNYYPKWVNDHELIYVESVGDNRQTFVKADMDRFRFQTNLMPRPGQPTDEARYAAAAALGSFVAQSCTSFGQRLTARESALYAANLTRAQCQELAQNWEQWRGPALASGEFFRLREPKRPGTQRVAGYGFAESLSRRGEDRFERAPSPANVASLTAADVGAICELLQ